MFKTVLVALLLLVSVQAWAVATLPTLPTTFEPGDTVPTPATSKFICATVNVTGATNASPIVLNTAAHFFTTGETVTVASVGGNTAANGVWVITKVDSTHISLNGSTGNGAYTSGGTIACDYATVTAFLSALSTNVWTGYLNQAETYVAPVAGYGSSTQNGFILPARAGASNYAVLRTWDDSSGHLPASGVQVGLNHRPYLAKIQDGTTNQAAMYAALTCSKATSYVWIKQIEFSLPAGQLSAGAQTGSPIINCTLPELSRGFSVGEPTDKPITAITFVGATVTISIDIATHGDMRLNTGEDITITCASCGITGINGKTYTMTRVNVGLCGGGSGTCQLTITEASVGGVYTSGGTLSVASPANSTQWPDHIVYDQIFFKVDNYQDAAQSAPHYKPVAVQLSGTNQAIINSFLYAPGGSSCEVGQAIYSNGSSQVMIRNNMLAASDFPIFTGGSAPYGNGIYDTDWTIKKNRFWKDMAWTQQGNVADSNWYNLNVCVKNSLEFKSMKRVLIDGNDFNVGWDQGRSQPTQLHINSLQGDASTDCGSAPGTPGVNAGCGPLTEVSDFTFSNNRVALMGRGCNDLGVQAGSNARYATVRGNRYLYQNNLYLSCGGFPGIISTPGLAVFAFAGGPQNLTLSHNTFVRDLDTSAHAFFMLNCYDTDAGTNPGCNSGAASDIRTATMPNWTVQDNIFPLHNGAAFELVSDGGGSRITCTTAGVLTAFASSYVWDHNIVTGAFSGGCSAPNTGTLATGTQVVADEASMNFRGYATHDYCLTASSPGYHAASDGTNVGVDMKALYNAMGLAYTAGACP